MEYTTQRPSRFMVPKLYDPYKSQMQTPPMQQSAFQYNKPQRDGNNRKPAGIRNIGNNCYMNSSIQCLFNLKEFKETIINSNPRETQSILYHTQALFKQMQNDPIVDPSQFYQVFIDKHPNFIKYRQEDAGEFMMSFLEDIAQETNKPIESSFFESIVNWFNPKQKYEQFTLECRKKENSIITDTFYGLNENTITCQQCVSKLVTYEEFNSINLCIEQTFQNIKSVTLTSLVEQYLAQQPIKNYQCANCQSLSTNQQIMIVRHPRVLIIQLKRFRLANYQQIDRINTNIVFNMEIFIQGKRYQLTSIIHHNGTPTYGHYYVSTLIQDRWYRIDDSLVEELNIEGKKYDKMGSPTPYILIFQQMN